MNRTYTYSQTVSEANRLMAISFKQAINEQGREILVKTPLSERFAKVAAKWFEVAQQAKVSGSVIIKISIENEPIII